MVFYKSLVSHGLVYPDIKESVYSRWDDLDYEIIYAILCQYHLALRDGPVLKLLNEKHESMVSKKDKQLYRAVAAVYRLHHASASDPLLKEWSDRPGEHLQDVREDLLKYVFIRRWSAWIKIHCHLPVHNTGRYYAPHRGTMALEDTDYIKGPHETDVSVLEFKEAWDKTGGMSILARCMNQ